MAPCDEEQQQQHHHLCERQRNEEGELRLPRGYISEDMISPVSLLRSDRFVKSRLTAKPPSRAQLWEHADIRPDPIFTDARPRTPNIRDKEVLHNDSGNSKLQDRVGNAPPKVRPEPKKLNMMQRGRTCPPAYQPEFESSHHESSDEETLLAGQSSNTNFRAQTNLSPLDRTGTCNKDTQKDNKRSPHRKTRASPTSTFSHPFPRPDRPSLLGADAGRKLLSQSPIRPSSAPRIDEPFQPSPLKSRPTTAKTRRPFKADESSNVDNQLYEHIRAFEAQQELSPPESRISHSPIMDPQDNASRVGQRGKNNSQTHPSNEITTSGGLINLTPTSATQALVSVTARR